jgi:hypothetical protein
MRRLVSLALGIGLTLALVGPAAAAKPDKTTFEPSVLPPEVFAGTCDFPVELVDHFASAREFVFGSHIMQTGGYQSTITNLDSGASLDVHTFSRLEIRPTAAGTRITTSGQVLWWTTEADALSTLGAGIWLITGRMRVTLDSETSLVVVPESIRGQVLDVCAALSA